jgi:chromosome segregation ATPase
VRRAPGGHGFGMTDHQEQIDEDKQQLDDLEKEIQEVRSHTQEFREEHEPHFVDDGARSEDVDDTIVPPG